MSKYVKENSHAFFHCDATQAIGKEKIDYSYVDLYNFSSHKFYGLKGSSVLVKKEKIIWTLNSLSEYFLSLRDFII